MNILLLEPEDQDVLVMRLDGHSYRTIAEALGVGEKQRQESVTLERLQS